MRTMDGNLNKRQFYPYTIYTSKNHKYHARNPIFYKIEQKGLPFETFREISTFFAKMQKIPYTIYTNQNHEYHTENLIFYSIEQKGLFTDNLLTTDAGRHPHKVPPWVPGWRPCCCL